MTNLSFEDWTIHKRLAGQHPEEAPSSLQNPTGIKETDISRVQLELRPAGRKRILKLSGHDYVKADVADRQQKHTIFREKHTTFRTPPLQHEPKALLKHETHVPFSRVDKLEEWAADFEASVRQRWATEDAERHDKKSSDENSESSDDDEDDENDSNPDGHMQNLNALAVVCLKGFDWNDIRRPKPAAPKSLLASAFRAYKRLLDPHGLRLLIIVFALLLAFIMVIILAALEDQFAAIKMFIYGDGYYYSYTWRYARTAHSRDGFTPVTAPNGTILGYTAAILGPGRPADELQRCHALLLPFADLLFAPNRTAAGLWALVNATAPDLRWVFSFCLAWEYAPLCAGLLEADAADEAAGPAAAADGLRGLYVPQCNVTGYAGSDGPPVSLDDWRALSAPPDEIVVPLTTPPLST